MRLFRKNRATQVAAIFALFSGAACGAWAQGPAVESGATRLTSKATPAASAKKREAAAKPTGGPHEGIKVHGDWTIVIRNEDGSVASRYEFKNSLASFLGANLLLAQLLAGDITSGKWNVYLNLSNSNDRCSTFFGSCTIGEPGAAIPWDSTNLVVSAPTTGPDAGKLILQGSVKLPFVASIYDVRTGLTTCPSSTTPNTCNPNPGGAVPIVTARILPTPIPVVANQTVDVTVVISFS